MTWKEKRIKKDIQGLCLTSLAQTSGDKLVKSSSQLGSSGYCLARVTV